MEGYAKMKIIPTLRHRRVPCPRWAAVIIQTLTRHLNIKTACWPVLASKGNGSAWLVMMMMIKFLRYDSLSAMFYSLCCLVSATKPLGYVLSSFFRLSLKDLRSARHNFYQVNDPHTCSRDIIPYWLFVCSNRVLFCSFLYFIY